MLGHNSFTKKASVAQKNASKLRFPGQLEQGSFHKLGLISAPSGLNPNSSSGPQPPLDTQTVPGDQATPHTRAPEPVDGLPAVRSIMLPKISLRG